MLSDRFPFVAVNNDGHTLFELDSCFGVDEN